MTASTKHEYGTCSACKADCERYDDDAWHHLGKPCSGFAFAHFISTPAIDLTKTLILDPERVKGF